MELRKQKEIEYYDKKAREQLKEFSAKKIKEDFEGFNPFLLKSYQFLAEFLKEKCRNKKILDYGCGNGIHSVWLAKNRGEVVGVDLSEKSLEIAKKRALIEGVADKTQFLLMDCENLKFPDKSFDIVFDGGTFSSLDLERVYPEISRVLKPGGFLIGIETFGHNPLANLKRIINKLTGKRTQWAASHIFKIKDLKEAEKYFNKQEVYFFHLISYLTFPFLKLPIGKFFLRFFEKIDKILIALPLFRKFAFKIVFVFYQPRQ